MKSYTINYKAVGNRGIEQYRTVASDQAEAIKKFEKAPLITKLSPESHYTEKAIASIDEYEIFTYYVDGKDVTRNEFVSSVSENVDQLEKIAYKRGYYGHRNLGVLCLVRG